MLWSGSCIVIVLIDLVICMFGLLCLFAYVFVRLRVCLQVFLIQNKMVFVCVCVCLCVCLLECVCCVCFDSAFLYVFVVVVSVCVCLWFMFRDCV